MATENRALNNEQKIVAHRHEQWDLRQFIYAAVRRYASCLPGVSEWRNSHAWIEFKNNLFYRHHIDLNTRTFWAKANSHGKKHVRVLNQLREDELQTAADLIASMCLEKGVDLSNELYKLSDGYAA